MAEVTKQDISELHKRIDEVVEIVTDVRVSQGKMETRLEMLVIPEIPERPCQFLETHMKKHKETIQLWEKPLVRTVIDLVKMAIVAVVTWLFVRKQ